MAGLRDLDTFHRLAVYRTGYLLFLRLALQPVGGVNLTNLCDGKRGLIESKGTRVILSRPGNSRRRKHELAVPTGSPDQFWPNYASVLSEARFGDGVGAVTMLWRAFDKTVSRKPLVFAVDAVYGNSIDFGLEVIARKGLAGKAWLLMLVNILLPAFTPVMLRRGCSSFKRRNACAYTRGSVRRASGFVHNGPSGRYPYS